MRFFLLISTVWLNLGSAAATSGPRLRLLPAKLESKMEGEPLAVLCLLENAEGLTPPSWYLRGAKGDTKIGKSGSVSANNKKNGVSLFFSNASRSEEGDYVCKAETDGDPLEQLITLRLNKPITFVNEETSQHPLVGETGKIYCRVAEAEVTWFKGPDQILEGGDRPYEFEDDGQVLIIPNFAESDNGDYKCLAIQTATGKTKSKIISVRGHVAPEIQNFPMVIAKEGEDAELICAATGFPAPKFVWFKGESDVGEQIFPDASDSEAKFGSPEDGVLRIKDVGELDNGTYTCKAENVVGSKTQIASLDVFLKPKINSEPIESRQSDKGSETALSCQFQGKEVDVYWQRNGQQYHSGEASEGNRIFAELENDSNLVLNLKSLELSDGGEYLCIASNPAGKAELTIQLEITHAPNMVIVSQLPKKSAIQKPLELQCEVEAVPKPKWSWKLNDVELMSNEHVVITESENALQSFLKIQSMAEFDFGTYKCIADNGRLPSAEDQIEVVRVYTPEKPIAVIDQLDEPQPDFIMFSVSNYNEQVEAARKPDFVVIRIIKKEKTEETEGDDATNQDGQIEPNENQWEMEKIKQIFFEKDDPWKIRISHLEPSNEYYLQVAGGNLEGNSEWFVSPKTFRTSAPKKPNAPVLGTADPIVCATYPCSVKWTPPADNGAAITEYRVRHRKIENYDGQPAIPLGDWSDFSQVTHDKLLTELQNLEPNSYYQVEVVARNQEGDSEAAVTHVRTGPGSAAASGPGTGAVVAIVIILILIILVVIDVSCYYMNRCGLLMCICTSCGRPVSGKDKVVTMEEGKPKNVVDDKQPLKDMHEGEKEPEEKPEPNEDTPMIVASKSSDMKNSSV